MGKSIYKNEFNEMISYLWLGSRRCFFFKFLKKHANKNFLLEVISSSTDKKLKKNEEKRFKNYNNDIISVNEINFSKKRGLIIQKENISLSQLIVLLVIIISGKYEYLY